MNIGNKWWRDEVGGLWDDIGKLQFELLLKYGLEPNHFLLDIGCGSLRGGRHFIKYLNEGNYFGIDKRKEILLGGWVEMLESGLENKKPYLLANSQFDFQQFNKKFDFALAQSLFTHLYLNDIILCLMNLRTVLKDNGKFFATFFENPDGKFNLGPINHKKSDGPDSTTFFNNDPFHYDFETFRHICENTDLDVTYIGDWNHPRNQKLLMFTKNPS